jgi:hypothetical protein
MVMDVKDVIAQNEFGMDYDQLGPNEKEWVDDEIEELNGELYKPGMFIDDEEWEKEMGR